MDRRKVKVDSEVRSFVVKVKREFKSVKIILFGSRAFGEPREYSKPTK
jgi:predicted nucleotidyltransferase